ncbi:MAG: Maf family protein, partial [Rhodospirillales bacterium]
MDRSKRRVVLGSASVVRGDILRDAGVSFVVEASTVEEGPIKTRCRKQGLNVEEATMALAEAKAADVAARHPGALVIGADQILECEERWFDKPQ